MCRPDCKMCVQLQDGLVSVRCTGGAILQKGVNGRKESTRLPCAALEVVCVCVCVSVCVCVCVCVCVNVPVHVLGQVIADVRKDRIAFILNGEVHLCGSGLLKWKHYHLSKRRNGRPHGRGVSFVRRLSFVSFVLCTVSYNDEHRTVMSVLLASTEIVFIQVGTAVLHKNLLG